MKQRKLRLWKVVPCVYEVWYVDEHGHLCNCVGEVGKYSALCKYDGFYSDNSKFLGVGDWQWVFYSIYFDESRVFDDYLSAFRYVRSLGSGA